MTKFQTYMILEILIIINLQNFLDLNKTFNQVNNQIPLYNQLKSKNQTSFFLT